MAEGASNGKLTIRPLTPAHVDDLKTVTAGTWGASCWCLFPRYTAAQKRERGLDKGGDAVRRAEVARLARRRNAPGLIAYRVDRDRSAVGPLAHRPLAGDTGRRRAGRLGHPLHHRPPGPPRPGRGNRDDPRGGRLRRKAWRAGRRGVPAGRWQARARRLRVLRHSRNVRQSRLLPGSWGPAAPAEWMATAGDGAPDDQEARTPARTGAPAMIRAADS